MTRGRADAYFEALQREFPALRIVHKEHDPFSRFVDGLLKLVTLGGQREYLTRYTTVLGSTIYVPTSWGERGDAERYITLRHEAVHLRQAARMGRFVMGLVYALPILPIGLAYGRARIEWEAYADTLRAISEVHGVAYARSPAVTEHIVRQFTTAAYLWMWPFPGQVRRWIARELDAIEAERGTTSVQPTPGPPY
ncbi:MAG: hypothetical protein OHK0013_23040 [Sandaracinaceae bacterium]